MLSFDEIKNTQTAKGFNLAQAAQAATVGSPTSTAVPKIDIPQVIDASSLQGAAPTSFDIQKILKDQQARQDSLFSQITGAFTPTVEEQAVQTNLTNLQNSQDTTQLSALAGIQKAEGQAIPMYDITGQQAQIAKQANLALQTLGVQQQAAARVLGNMQASRQSKLDAAKFMYDANRNSLEDTLKIYQMSQPQNLSFQIDKTTGEGVAVMKNPVTGEVYTKNVGKVVAAEPPKLDTQVVEIGKRKVLINTQTGQAIKDLGASPSSTSSSGGLDFGSLFSNVGKNANNDSIKAAVTQMAAYLPSTQQKAFVGNIERLLKEGKTKEAAESLITSSINLVGEAATREKLRGKYIATKQLDNIQSLLDQFKQAGGDTNLLTGSLEKISQKVGNTSNQQLAYIWGRIRTSIIAYRQSVSGAAFTEPERKDYNSLFPDISASGKVNEARIQALKDSFDLDIQGTLETILGTGNYNALQTTIKGDPYANYANQVNNVSLEEQYAAALAGNLPQAQAPVTNAPPKPKQPQSEGWFAPIKRGVGGFFGMLTGK